MKNQLITRRGFLLTASTTAAALPALAQASGLGGGTLSEEDLIFLREEEKLARDVYLTLYDRWRMVVHDNIADSEQRHTDSVLGLLDLYGIPDPVISDAVGAFTHPVIDQLYQELVALGSTSEIDALVVGATIEDMDILDITEMLHRTDATNVTRVMSSLRCGSHSHARAFVSALEGYGVSYTPQYTTVTEWHAILGGTSLDC